MLNTNIGSMMKRSNHIQSDQIANTVKVSNDYSKFTKLDGNRNLNQLHYLRLLKSVQNCNLLNANPILVNEKFNIINGQHRYEVCKELNLPIYYIMVDNLGLSEIQILNANSKNWKMEDYIDGYCNMGYPEYCYLKDIIKRYDVGVTSLLAIFASSGANGSVMHELIAGNLKLSHKNRGLVILQWLNDWTKYYAGAKRRTFVLALVHLYNVKNYDHLQMIRKMQFQSTKIFDCTKTSLYIPILEEIYNYKERGEKVRFF